MKISFLGMTRIGTQACVEYWSRTRLVAADNDRQNTFAARTNLVLNAG